MLSERRVDSKRDLDVLMLYSAVLLRMQCFLYDSTLHIQCTILVEQHDSVDNDQAPKVGASACVQDSRQVTRPVLVAGR